MRAFSLATLFIALCLISSQSHAFDCNKASTKAEKLICKKESLVKMDEDYNSAYSKAISALSKEDKKALTNKIKNLLSARDSCIKSGQEFANSKKSTENFLSEPFKSHKLSGENFAQGCIATWYNSISNALLNQKDSALFRVPSSEEYLKEFNNLKEKPYIFSIVETDQEMVKICQQEDRKRDCSHMQNQYLAELTYTIFFPTNGESFAKITQNSYSQNAGAAHGGWSGSSKFITKKGETQKINNSGYSCSIPLKDPVVVNKNVYLPEQISFNKFFNGMLGEFGEFQCYACSGSYHADCLMRLRKIDNSKNSYIVFNAQDFTQDPISGADKISSKEHRKCALEIIKNHQSKVEELKNSQGLQDIEYLAIEESSVQPILLEIKRDCRKKALGPIMSGTSQQNYSKLLISLLLASVASFIVIKLINEKLDLKSQNRIRLNDPNSILIPFIAVFFLLGSFLFLKAGLYEGFALFLFISIVLLKIIWIYGKYMWFADSSEDEAEIPNDKAEE